eukprot:TRINITY_DN5596_c0_g1_i1.p1 TRINITY_DN5596_c0_g1~~TRINITY_DN5596_c0_g1_i1.p1  ORF type:complete len:741 (+),score=116.16 TRINITY_DN5596_c0_g1_i1:134-2356(+)
MQEKGLKPPGEVAAPATKLCQSCRTLGFGILCFLLGAVITTDQRAGVGIGTINLKSSIDAVKFTMVAPAPEAAKTLTAASETIAPKAADDALVAPTLKPWQVPQTAVVPNLKPWQVPKPAVAPTLKPWQVPQTDVAPTLKPWQVPQTAVVPTLKPWQVPQTDVVPTLKPWQVPQMAVAVLPSSQSNVALQTTTTSPLQPRAGDESCSWSSAIVVPNRICSQKLFAKPKRLPNAQAECQLQETCLGLMWKHKSEDSRSAELVPDADGEFWGCGGPNMAASRIDRAWSVLVRPTCSAIKGTWKIKLKGTLYTHDAWEHNEVIGYADEVWGAQTHQGNLWLTGSKVGPVVSLSQPNQDIKVVRKEFLGVDVPKFPTPIPGAKKMFLGLGKPAAPAQDGPDLQSALQCLRMTTPELRGFVYPADAEAHFEEVNRTTAMFVWKYHKWAGHDGPWIENYWIKHFGDLWKNRQPGVLLKDIFGPFIPILAPWVDTTVAQHHRYGRKTWQRFRENLRPNVLYITVSQNDEGIPARDDFQLEEIPNLLVLSAGGHGHVAVPLLKQIEKIRSEGMSMYQRKYFVSYMGSLNHSPGNVRRLMDITVTRWGKAHRKEVKVGSGNDWKEVMANSCLSLAPRGFGRSAFHIMETLQMGLVPIYVWFEKDIPWLPYPQLWKDELIGFSTLPSESHLGALLNRLAANMSRLEEMEARIRSMRTSHFLPEGIMSQIQRFMLGQPNDLRCRPLPESSH